MPDRLDSPDPHAFAQRTGSELVRSGNHSTPFDRWLSRRLHEAYDTVLREQLPAELEQLVRQLAESPAQASCLNGIREGKRLGVTEGSRWGCPPPPSS